MLPELLNGLLSTIITGEERLVRKRLVHSSLPIGNPSHWYPDDFLALPPILETLCPLGYWIYCIKSNVLLWVGTGHHRSNV